MQPNTTTANNTEKIQQIINKKYNEDKQLLNLSTLVFTQSVVVMIGGVYWSSEIGVHSVLST